MVTVGTHPRRRRSARLAVDVTAVLTYQSAMAKSVRDSAYWQRRLAREHPEIAERLRSGEIPSVRAAAIEAGLIRERKPLDDLRRAWAKAARGERRAFLAEVGATAPVVDHDRLAKMSDDELSAELKRASLGRLASSITRAPRRARPWAPRVTGWCWSTPTRRPS